MDAFPLSWPLAGRQVALIGAGEFARRKLNLLIKTPAEIVVWDAVSRLEDPRHEDSKKLQADAAFATVRFNAGWPSADALKSTAFVIVALEDRAEADRAAALVREAGAPLNVVDRPDLSDFHIPAIVDRGELTIAIATGGTAPALARDVRAAIEAAAPASLTQLSRFAKSIRGAVRAIADYDTRRLVWERILRGPAGERARAGDFAAAETLAAQEIANPDRRGVVHIVGAGPGDPELLTLKALRTLQDADLIVHDRLVDPRILDMARRDAERIYVGKTRSKHSVPQDQINELLVAQAQAGRRVVRLKGGDPFIFGRGGEELEALKAAGLETHVVPGITAALGCAAATQLPLTHRDHAQAVTFITGHAKTGGALDLDWSALAAANHTLVVYMGAANAAEVSARLLDAGRAGDTPAVIIENGARPEQRAIASTLATLASDVARLDLKSPTLLIVGEAAALADAKQVSEFLEFAEHQA